MKIIYLILLFSFLNHYAQDDAVKKYFPGTWKMENDKAEMYEEWSVTNDTELTGVNYSIDEGNKVVFENVTLKKFADYWGYVAVPERHAPTLFTLVESSEGKFIFENKEHDYPQRIIYKFHPDGKLNAAIEGDIKGEFKRKDYYFIKVDDSNR